MKIAVIAAKKIVSLQPIYKERDVDIQYDLHDNVENNNHAMFLAAKEYIMQEMKVKEHEIPNIVNVFPPAGGAPSYDRLYVEFESEHAANHISSFARYIVKPDHHVDLYFPRMFQPRLKVLGDEARRIREAPGLNKGDMKTKIVYTEEDIQLLSKPRDGRWSRVFLNPDNLPPIFANSSDPSSYPPAGRNRSALTENLKRSASSPLGNISKACKSSKAAADVVASGEIPKENDVDTTNHNQSLNWCRPTKNYLLILD